ncbi:MAG: Xaa-Pro peptidase family protein [Alicyclobacillus sp.]|nr:Xaa-Pro peptidase family protein [Alicyclobacillus sp.]
MAVERWQRLRAELTARGLAGLLVTRPENRFYLTGFRGSAGAVLVTSDTVWLVTDFRYVEQAAQECPGVVVVQQEGTLSATLTARLPELSITSLGFEADHLTYAEVTALRALEQLPAPVSLIPCTGVVEGLRQSKDDAELACIEQAVRVADAAYAHIRAWIRPGLTEKEVAWELEQCMRRLGASGPSFPTIVASGWRSALPHGVASDKVIAAGELVTLDFGAVVNGYCSDLTRTLVLGSPTPQQQAVYETVLAAQQLALAAARPGMRGSDLDAVARDALTAAGYGPHFGHSLGHGIGLAIHEQPRIGKNSTDVLSPGMVVTIEPGVYLPGWGGVRIEDDVVVTCDGVRVLTAAPKDDWIVS